MTQGFLLSYFEFITGVRPVGRVKQIFIKKK